MKKCDFCGEFLERRVEKGFVESYGLVSLNDSHNASHIQDPVVELIVLIVTVTTIRN